MGLDMDVVCRIAGRGLRVQEHAGHRNMKRRVGSIVFLLLVLAVCAPCHAYAGPGAGFAVLSSFWTLFLAFLYSVYAFFSWPFRQAFRLLRRRKAAGKAQVKRAVILGFHGMDPELTERFIGEG